MRKSYIGMIIDKLLLQVKMWMDLITLSERGVLHLYKV